MRMHMALILVSDMARSVAFYRDVLGLSLRFESTHWSEFDTEGTTLALHLSDAPPTADTSGSEPAGRCRPGFRVTDLHAFHARMQQYGVRCVSEPELVFGSWVARYTDPDGLVFGASEGPNNVH
jgi:lactoylglutathione lyase